MHIVYSVSTCSDRVYAQLFADSNHKPSFQAQKYHRLIIEGLAANADVDVVAAPPVNRRTMDRAFLRLPNHKEGGANYHHLLAVRNPVLKALTMAFGTFFKTVSLADRDSVVVVDCLNRVVSLSALLAARLRGRRCVCIVTDLPDLLDKGSFGSKISNFTIRHSTDYILLTQAMADYLKICHKPYVVLEGQADITMKSREPSLSEKRHPRVVLYAGGVFRKYGADKMVAGFQMADLPNAQLHIYGPGDYVEELKRIAREDPRIIYGGMLLSSQVVEKEQQATLLINPRPTHEEFVKYSFPSKTMEYMSTGTPVLTTVLPGMPKEYHPYVYLLEEESPEGIAQKLTELFALSDEELFQKGLMARQFILEEKNNVVQGKKILNMLTKQGDVAQ